MQFGPLVARSQHHAHMTIRPAAQSVLIYRAQRLIGVGELCMEGVVEGISCMEAHVTCMFACCGV